LIMYIEATVQASKTVRNIKNSLAVITQVNINNIHGYSLVVIQVTINT
jgi:hypothetical protein